MKSLALKRLFDILVASSLLILLAPILLALCILVGLFHGWPPVFVHKRPGLNAKLFNMYKFRSMSNERGPDGQLLPDDRRLTKFGQLLRSTSLDELPELLNVLRGDMSLVGPRPLLCEYLPLYNEEQSRRHLVKPGITGWAQINGRNNITWEDKFKLDLWYVNHWNLLLDLKIILGTITKILTRQDINEPGQSTASRFMGNE